MFGHSVNDFYHIENAHPDSDGLIQTVLLPLRDMVLFPNIVTPLFVGREKSLAAIATAQAENKTVIAALQRDPNHPDPGAEDIFMVGVEVALGRLLHMPDGTTSILAQGRRRVQIVRVEQTEPFFVVTARLVEDSAQPTRQIEALMRAVLTLFERCVRLNRNLSDESYIYAINIDDPAWLADLIASTLQLSVNEQQTILETFDVLERLHRISVLLGRELDVLELEEQIHARVQMEVDRGQRENFLREQMRVIQSELGELDIFQQELTDLQDRLNRARMPAEIYEKASRELNRLFSIPPMAPEVGVIRTYLDTLLDLPWDEASEDNLDIGHAQRVLENQHYAMNAVKERILEYLAVRKLAADRMRSPILCFLGPPGTGKTSVGKSIASAMGREFVRVSLGGVRDEAEIRGHRRTYIGALPGRIINGIRRAGTVNPVFVLDEIDKLGSDFRGDPSAAMLEVLDPEQNFAFSDHYLEVPYDLSRVLFITTANSADTIPYALRDRMEIIEFPSYIDEEKLEIARHFLIPRQIMEHGLERQGIKFDDEAVKAVIRGYTREAGVRQLDRELAGVCRKLARQVAEDKKIPKKITAEKIQHYLGVPEFLAYEHEREDRIGLANSMAWSLTGGEILSIEANIVPGNGKLQLTGKLGDVMQESARAAYSYLQSRAAQWNIDPARFDRSDIHIHVPSGAVPKDGPSAGITIAVALISAFTERPVRHDIALTGEITLRGRVLPIGGLREKVLAAHRAGMKQVLFPAQNGKDLTELPPKILKELTLHPVNHMDEVLMLTLGASPNTLAASSALPLQ